MPARRITNVRSALSGILVSRGWKQKDLARASGVPRGEVAQHLSGARKVSWKHLDQYCMPLDEHERGMLLAAWIRDNGINDLVQTWLPVSSSDDLAPAVRDWTPPLDDEGKRKFEWLAREVQRDAELGRYVWGLIDALGYHGKRRPRKKRKPGEPSDWASDE